MTQIHPTRDASDWDCPRCGRFTLTRSAEVLLPRLSQVPEARAVLSHLITQRQAAGGEFFTVSTSIVDQTLEDPSLPTVAEQADNLILMLGAELRGREGTEFRIDYDLHYAKIGGASARSIPYLLQGLETRGLLSREGELGHTAEVALTFDGWAQYEALKRGRSDSRTAFMAMKIGSERLDRVFRECFKPAVTATGFSLVRLDEQPQAGLIDDRLRVAILKARFLIADLTDGNHGAYWEAGFAEGLRMPVIYTCEKLAFDTPRHVHFDTSHFQHVLWEESALEKAAEDLKATIRWTLPGEAKFDD